MRRMVGIRRLKEMVFTLDAAGKISRETVTAMLALIETAKMEEIQLSEGKYDSYTQEELVEMLEENEAYNRQLLEDMQELKEVVKKLFSDYDQIDNSIPKKHRKPEEKRDCSTCANSLEYPLPHTCDICTSLDQEEGFSMWRAK